MQHRRRLASILLLLVAGGALAAAEPDPRLPELARSGDRAAVATLLAEGAVDVDSPGVDGTTALHWAAYADDAELASLLLEAGADPNAANRNGATPLILACANANPALIEGLLEAGADPSLAPNGEPPILGCARTGRVAALRALLGYGASVDAADTWRGQTSLMWAAAENHAPILNVLLENGAAVDAPSTGGFNALMFAVRQDARNAARLLIAAGADVNVQLPGARRDAQPAAPGPSLLSMAVTNGHYTMAAMLLEAGADADARDPRGNSILHNLVQRRSPQRHLANQFVDSYGVDPTQLDSLELMRMLVARGADPNARTEPTPIRHERWTDEGDLQRRTPVHGQRRQPGRRDSVHPGRARAPTSRRCAS